MVQARRARWITAAVLAVVALPGALALVGVDHDDFPFSTYPMFARPRAETTTLSGAVAVAHDGTEARLDPQTIAGSPEPLLAKALVDDALGGDAGPLCRRLLDRVDGATVLLVQERVRAVDHYLGDDSATERVRTIDCEEVG
jgi:hypothetical protein